MKANNMPCILPEMDIPQVLVTDFAPLSQYEEGAQEIDRFFLVPAFNDIPRIARA